MEATSSLKRTPLYDLHKSLGAKMVPFAGFEMPVHYEAGILKEHRHTREAAGLFDISHMGQIVVEGPPEMWRRLEAIMPADLLEMPPGRVRYSFLLNERGGVIDDLMIARPRDEAKGTSAYIVVNASGRETDLNHLTKHLGNSATARLLDRGLLALQGPKAASVLSHYCDAADRLKFMQAENFTIPQVGLCNISRSGYTGEDGFEISVPNDALKTFAEKLLSHAEVAPIGLGARDSLRLEAGLCLYGHDLDEGVSPIEANLLWAIGKRRRREGQFIGADIVQKQITDGVSRKLVALKPEGRILARENTSIADKDGHVIGRVTSGGFGPSVDGPICLGYVDVNCASKGTSVNLVVREKAVTASVVTLPFIPHHYVKG